MSSTYLNLSYVHMILNLTKLQPFYKVNHAMTKVRYTGRRYSLTVVILRVVGKLTSVVY